MTARALALALIGLFSGAALLSGCATVVKGTSQTIAVTSEPSGARVQIDGSFAGTTPTHVSLSRRQNHVVSIEHDGHDAEHVAVTKSLGNTVAGNILAGGVVGWGVDAMTGAQYNLSPDTIHVRLRPKSDSAANAAAAARVQEFIDALNALDQALMSQSITPEEYTKQRTALFEKYQRR